MRIQPMPLLALALLSAACAAPQAPAPQAAAPPPAAASRPAGAGAEAAEPSTGDVHDFDFLIGDRVGQNRRLKARGVGSNEWDEFVGVSHTTQFLGGMVNIGEMNFPAKGWSGVTMRVFNPATKKWAIFWVSSKRGVLDPSQVGTFKGDRGEFYGEDQDNGRHVKVRYTWTKTGPNTARWEQAFSYDGRSWETNWTSDFVRTPPSEKPKGP